MQIKKVDYTLLSGYYDDVKVQPPNVSEFYLSKIGDLRKIFTGSVVLDVGCRIVFTHFKSYALMWKPKRESERKKTLEINAFAPFSIA